MFRFKDRADAGRYLAERLMRYSGASDTVVLGLPRGGVVVAHEIAEKLVLPLDVFRRQPPPRIDPIYLRTSFHSCCEQPFDYMYQPSIHE